MPISDEEFEKLLIAALYKASEIDYEGEPSDDELDQIVQPSPRFRRKMKSLLRNPDKYIRNQRKPIYIKVLQNAAVVFIVFTILLGAIIAVSPTVRAGVIDFVRSWFEDRTEYLTPEDELSYKWSFGYFPEGFELLVEQDYGVSITSIYKNNNALITVIISRGKQVLDNEHAIYYQVERNKRTIDIYESTDPLYPNIVVLHDDNTGSVISINSDINLNELIKIAESIK